MILPVGGTPPDSPIQSFHHHSDLEEKKRLAIQFLQVREREDRLEDEQVRMQSAYGRAILDFNKLERDVRTCSLNLELTKFQTRFNYECYVSNLNSEEKPDLDKNSFENLLHTGEPSFIRGSSPRNVLQIEEVEEKKELDPKGIQKLMKWRIKILKEKIEEVSKKNEALNHKNTILEEKILTCRRSIRQLKNKRDYLEREKERIILIGRAYQRKINELHQRELVPVTFVSEEPTPQVPWGKRIARAFSGAKKKVNILPYM